ncbi:Ribonuclease H-like superfamily [Sesbania bispinosa]|nr:Ribonuclease H-like superfamily [Sesbania bispinosa]
MVSWIAPINDQVALNVDDSVIINPRIGGFGGLIRDCHGDWHCGFHGHVNHCDNIKDELLALLYGLQLAFLHLHQYGTIIRTIQDFLPRQWSITVHHTLREMNFNYDDMP